jgi:predicted dithiol-disulfide oxidoreductase (DUF899 family)
MCPACMTAAALWIASATSAGGLGALTGKNLLRARTAAKHPTTPRTKETMMERKRIVSREEWQKAREGHLAKEKELTRLRDELSRERRELPWVKLDTSYVFDTPDGKRTLAELFDGHSQLVVYHFMFGPDWEEGCPSCSLVSDHFDGTLPHLAARDVAMTVVSRAPLPKIEGFKKRMSWRFRWVSSYGNDFNRDFHVTFTPQEIEGGAVEYNYKTQEFPSQEAPGLSVFYKDARGDVFHTYSSYGRGVEAIMGTYAILDLVPKGRDEDQLEFSMEWVRHHDRYGTDTVADADKPYWPETAQTGAQDRKN